MWIAIVFVLLVIVLIKPFRLACDTQQNGMLSLNKSTTKLCHLNEQTNKQWQPINRRFATSIFEMARFDLNHFISHSLMHTFDKDQSRSGAFIVIAVNNIKETTEKKNTTTTHWNEHTSAHVKRANRKLHRHTHTHTYTKWTVISMSIPISLIKWTSSFIYFRIFHETIWKTIKHYETDREATQPGWVINVEFYNLYSVHSDVNADRILSEYKLGDHQSATQADT